MTTEIITPFRPPRDGLYREVALPSVVEFRAAEDLQQEDDLGPDYIGLMRGHFLVFNQWTEINSIFEGNFLERFAPSSVTKTLTENRDSIRVLFQHGRDPVLGDKPLGPIRDMYPDRNGAYYEVPLLDTAYNRELLPGLKEGLYGASHRFRVLREEIRDDPGASDYNPKGLPERTIKEAQILEFGPVTFPAYEGASAGVRSTTDVILFGDLAREPDKLRVLVEAVRSTHLVGATERSSEDSTQPETPAVTVINNFTQPNDDQSTTDRDAAPPADRAAQERTRRPGRRDSRPLYGDPERRQAWRL